MHYELQNKKVLLFLFGASGDLATNKVIPALYDLEDKNKLPINLEIHGVSRRDWTDSNYVSIMQENLRKSKSEDVQTNHKSFNPTTWNKLAKKLHFVSGNFDDAQTYKKIHEVIKTKNIQCNTKVNNKSIPKKNNQYEIIFFFSIAPEFYSTVLNGVYNSKLNTYCKNSSTKLVIEKPFGHDYNSAKELNNQILHSFTDEQVYRIDHVLGKDTLQDIITFRKNNFVLQKLLDNQFLDHIQISYLENKGVGERGSFYEKTGVIRDMVQNHLLQMLATATAEIPENLDMLSKNRAEIIKHLKPVNLHEIAIGQYKSDRPGTPSYTKETGIDKQSKTPTFVALKTEIQTTKWKNIPIYMRTGKALSQKFTEILFVFKSSEQNNRQKKYSNASGNLKPNILAFRIQPQEGVFLCMTKADHSANEDDLSNITLDFCYKNSQDRLKDGYENLLYNVFLGDHAYFVDIEEVLNAWKFVDPINHAIELDNATLDKIESPNKSSHSKLYLENYEVGHTDGTPKSIDLIEKENNKPTGRKWYTHDFQAVCKI